MALFRRAPRHPISDFWTWWNASGADVAEKAIRRGNLRAVARAIGPRVAAIDPDLVWETSLGTSAQHRLTVSANGAALLRPLAERWLRAAPTGSAIWEFRASRERSAQPMSGQSMQIAGHLLALGDVLFEVDPDEKAIRIHVAVFHPEFGDMPDDARMAVARVLLDAVIGEDDVERWIGKISTSQRRKGDAVDAVGLSLAVSELSAPFRLNGDRWTRFHGNDQNGDPYTGLIRRGVRWIDAPTMDLHQMVRLAYQSNADGLPVPEEVDRLDEGGRKLSAAVGRRVIFLGHIDNQGARTFHYYSDSEDQNVTSDLAGAADSLDASITSIFDPSWSQMRQVTG